jgi:copper homeostasis protein
VASTDLPVRAMVRAAAGFAALDLTGLVRTADELLDVGVTGLVLGFLDRSGRVDLDAVTAVAERLDGSPWTFHRAIDHARDYAEAFADVRDLPGLDAVLTAGSPDGVSEGVSRLAGRVAAGDGSLLMAGGGLTASLVPQLRAVGVQAFHIGRTAREERSWSRPVSREAVAEWKRITSLPAPAPSQAHFG